MLNMLSLHNTTIAVLWRKNSFPSFLLPSLLSFFPLSFLFSFFPFTIIYYSYGKTHVGGTRGKHTCEAHVRDTWARYTRGGQRKACRHLSLFTTWLLWGKYRYLESQFLSPSRETCTRHTCRQSTHIQ